MKESDSRISNYCPVCHCATLAERGMFDICPVCFWEDDGSWSEEHPDEPNGGPNYALSLSQARKNFVEFGACEHKHIKDVRQPTLAEAHSEQSMQRRISDTQAKEKSKHRLP